MKNYLTEKIIRNYENRKKGRNGELKGNQSFPVQQEDYDKCGRMELNAEAMELEKQGLVRLNWYALGSELTRVYYSLEKMPEFYEISGMQPKYEVLESYIRKVKEQLAHTKKEWIRLYLTSLLEKAKQGKMSEQYLTCFHGLDELEGPMYKRIFSSKYLNDSKTFENKLKRHVITTARNFHPDVEDTMTDSQVLEQIYIDEYSQELAVKGPLNLTIEGNEVELSDFRYGTVLNSQTLTHAVILKNQNIRKIISIENKANFMSMPFEDGVLYLFSHGYFSPKEAEFLRGLARCLEGSQVEYYHSGDLDYGGIRIYRYIKEKIFPELMPLNMDEKIYRKYLGYGEPLKDSVLKKLQNLSGKIPEELEPLYRDMLKEGIGIEQEIFLADMSEHADA